MDLHEIYLQAIEEFPGNDELPEDSFEEIDSDDEDAVDDDLTDDSFEEMLED